LSLGGRYPAATRVVLAMAALGWAAGAAHAQVQPPADQPLFDRMKADAKVAIAAAVAAGRPAEALDTYDRYYTSTRKHEPSLLAAVAKGVLWGVAGEPASLSRIDALERLARAGDARAMGELAAEAGGRNTLMPEGIQADCALARLGDAGAIDRLIQRLGDDTLREKGLILSSLAEAGAKRAAGAIVPFLADENPGNREGAARALAKLGSREQIAPVRAAFDAEWHPAMRQTLAMTLHCLGSPAGDALLKELESSRMPEVRLVAVEAYHARNEPRWSTLARALLRSSSEGARLRAAVLLGAADPEAAKELAAAAASTNVATREVGARLLEAAGSRDFTLLLTLLHDSSPVVRTYAAGAVLAATR
jgi:HEAT repeat protein